MRTLPKELLVNWLCEYRECCYTAMLSSSSPTRGLPVSAEEMTEDQAMATLTPSRVSSNFNLLQPKIEIDLCSQDDLNLVRFQQLETQLLDSMEIAEQQSSQSHLPEVFDDGYTDEVDGNIKMLSPEDENTICIDDMPPACGDTINLMNVRFRYMHRHYKTLTHLPCTHHRASKSLTKYKYDAVVSSNGTEKGCPRESATTANFRTMSRLDEISTMMMANLVKEWTDDDTLGAVTKAQLRNALASTHHKNVLTIDTLEAKQKRLEERIEANERVMRG